VLDPEETAPTVGPPIHLDDGIPEDHAVQVPVVSPTPTQDGVASSPQAPITPNTTGLGLAMNPSLSTSAMNIIKGFESFDKAKDIVKSSGDQLHSMIADNLDTAMTRLLKTYNPISSGFSAEQIVKDAVAAKIIHPRNL